MQKLLKHILEQEDRILNEFDYKKSLKIAAVAGALGGAALLPQHLQTHTKSDSAVAPPITPDTVQTQQLVTTQAVKPEQINNAIAELYPGEYDVIKKAADRNNCTGEDFLILLAIRKAENGGPGREFGILHPDAIDTDLNTQAGWAAATVVKNRARWIAAERQEDYVSFLGRRYCPVGADNDPTGLNIHWIKNVNHWVYKLKSL